MADKHNFMAGLQQLAYATQGNRYLMSIANGFTSALPVLIIGAFSILLANIPIDSYSQFITETGLKPLISLPATVTINMMSLYVVFLIAYKLAESLDHNGIVVGMIALICFLITTPIDVLNNVKVLPITYLGAGGLFVAIFVALAVNAIYSTVIKLNWVINMGDNVPETVSQTFNGLIAALVNAVIFTAVAGIFKLTPDGSIHAFIYHSLQQPLLGITGSFGGLLVFVTVSNILWLFGIHGTMVTGAVWKPIYIALDIENLAAMQNGDPLPHIIGYAFYICWANIGGGGSTFGLNLLMAFRARSEALKKLGRMTLLTSFMRINEPLVFGIPLILNPVTALPFIISPIVNVSIAYWLTVLEVIPRMMGIFPPVGLPIFANVLMQGSFLFVLLQLVLIVLNTAIYYPFFKRLDSMQVEKTRLDIANAQKLENQN
ncbi:PTS sugar transporter subunit IIC [Brenneria corticis]|uniref:Permease IIC component n=1 Tax=Brenneria corticis TaxID=2173106 RepID=A0A2U1U142_9GAMM|nr:PTS transporter subunit EIIC [Brenneria sp. CFCC 11842]PWC15379.1 PTS sugar transporter subunit IIC [Brenneria sp. CFCC 11842]